MGPPLTHAPSSGKVKCRRTSTTSSRRARRGICSGPRRSMTLEGCLSLGRYTARLNLFWLPPSDRNRADTECCKDDTEGSAAERDETAGRPSVVLPENACKRHTSSGWAPNVDAQDDHGLTPLIYCAVVALP